MPFDQQEEFFGTGRASANLRANANLGLLFELVVGLLFITMWWWAAPDESTGAVNGVYRLGYLVSPLIGLYFLYRFVRDVRPGTHSAGSRRAVVCARPASAPYQARFGTVCVCPYHPQ